MKSYKVLGLTTGTTKNGNAYTRVSVAEENNEKWEGVHAFEAFLKGSSEKLKPGVTVNGVVTYLNGSASLNI